MSATPAGPPPRILIPRWIQLVGLPLLVVLAWVIATTAAHVVILFVVAALIALLLDPIVRTLGRVGVRRGLGVALVWLTFAGALIVAIVALGTVVVGQTRSAADRFNAYFSVKHGQTHTAAYRDVNRLQLWLNTHHLRSVKIEKSGHRLVRKIQQRDVGKYTHRVVTFVEGAAISIGRGIFDSVLIIVISIYMLLGMERFGRSLDRRFPPHGGLPLLVRVEHALLHYVRGQLLLSVIIGTTAGLGLYILGVTGLLPGGDKYALVLGAWVAVTEVLPYVGPWLGAVPALIYALVVHPISAVWVALLFLGIHQLEGHLVVPNVLGSALRLHPLLVIFGLLLGTAIYGLAGALMALPLLAVGRATWEFFAERVVFEPWSGGGTIPVEVEPVPPDPEPNRSPRRPRSTAERVPFRCASPRRSGEQRRPARVSAFPVTRLRRLRRTGALRDLVRETTLSLDDLVLPLFVAPNELRNERLPALSRLTTEGTVRECEELLRAGVKAVMLFGIPEEKDDEGSGAWIPDGIVQQALRALRQRFPELLLLTDVCLCEYTAHGHCGVVRGDEVDNDASLELIARTAVSHVEAGADAVCPSDMMDGRVAAIRAELPETPIVAYSAKYASAFYGPFREAADSAPAFGDRRGYQMDPGNVREALRECELDVAEGADVIMVKPALPYLDVIRAVRDRLDLPLAAFNVSGEYAMVKAAAAAGDLDERAAALESLTAIRRAGADIVVTYWAKELASWLEVRSDLWHRAQKLIPGGVNSPVRAMQAVGLDEPFFVARGEGAYLETTDGRTLLDWVQSWGPLIFGHADPETVEAVREAALDGTSFGAPTEREVELAAEIVDAVPSVEKVRLVSSGTEAAMSAIRLARAFTHCDRVLKFEGGYHGHADAFLASAGSGLATLGIPSSPGVPEAVTAGTIVAPYNDLDAAAAAVERYGEGLAAVIVEPVAGNMGCVPPVPGFLEGLRMLCDASGALLVFDEVITGFRVARGGAQARFGITPDLTILGKIVGGGLPLAAFGGRAEVMSRLAPVGNVYQAGTLSGNPLATAAGVSVLRRLRDEGAYEELERRSARLEAGLARFGLVVQRVGAMLTFFGSAEPVTSFRELDTERYGVLFRGLLDRGIYVAPSQYECMFPSLAHGDEEIDATIEAFGELDGG